MLEKFIDKPWNFDKISKLHSEFELTEDFFDRHVDKPWNWRYIDVCAKFIYKHWEKIPKTENVLRVLRKDLEKKQVLSAAKSWLDSQQPTILPSAPPREEVEGEITV